MALIDKRKEKKIIPILLSQHLFTQHKACISHVLLARRLSTWQNV